MQNKLDQYRKLADDLAANRTSRRNFLKRASALGLSTPMMSALLGVTGSALTLAPKPSRAASHGDNQVVVASWGGGFGDAQRAAQFAPFTEETGIEIVLAPQQPEIALLQAQVESGNVEWDLSNNSFVGAYTLANKGFLEEIDYSAMNADIVDGINPLVRGKHSVGIYFWAMNLGYSLDYFTESEHPTNWAEFWDVEKFPGRRTMAGGERGIRPNLEFALLADGVPKDKLYPIDQDRAWKSLSRMKDHVIKWWTDSGLSPQLLVTNEAVLATAFNGRVDTLKLQGQPIDIELNEAANRTNNWSVPKGTKQKENAMRLVASFSIPERQARLAELIAYGPTNRLAFKHLSVERAREMPSGPENEKRGFWLSDQWWADNGGDVATRWSKWILE
jgi:putative spermidine/putrescine transport system substrate-binding protein